MAPQRMVINQGATKTQRAATAGSFEPDAVARIMNDPSAKILISRDAVVMREPARIDHPAAAADVAAASHTRQGSRGSDRAAASASPIVEAPSAAAAARQSRRSRADGCRSDQPRITQSRLKTRVPFVPPKPNEFLSATPIFSDRAVLAQ